MKRKTAGMDRTIRVPVCRTRCAGFFAIFRPMSSIFTRSATAPYTATVMTSAITARIARVDQMPSPLSRLAREMSMISVERMRSVRTAPSTSFLSSRAPSSAWPCCTPNHSSTFSAPSKHRYEPPRISR